MAINILYVPAAVHVCACAGVVSTAVSARLLLGLGLMATAAVNLAFGASSSMAAFCTLWGINGMLQVCAVGAVGVMHAAGAVKAKNV
jgi:sugar phosphate permease